MFQIRQSSEFFMIQIGQKIPEATLRISKDTEGACALPQSISTSELFKGKVVLFAVPGAFTPGCHLQHLPGFVAKQAEILSSADKIICLATNDVFVMHAWGQALSVGKIMMVSDDSGDFVKKLDLFTANGMVRAKRFALVAQDGVVSHIAEGGLEVSGAEAILSKL